MRSFRKIPPKEDKIEEKMYVALLLLTVHNKVKAPSVAHTWRVCGTNLQENHSNGIRVTVEKTNSFPSNVPLCNDKSQPNFNCLYHMRGEGEVTILRKIPPVEAEILPRTHISLQVKYPSLSTYRNQICTVCSSCVDCATYEFSGGSLQLKQRYNQGSILLSK
jgi:hypothetical protein